MRDIRHQAVISPEAEPEEVGGLRATSGESAAGAPMALSPAERRAAAAMADGK